MKKKILPEDCKIGTKRESHVIKNEKDVKVVEVLEEIYTRKISRRKAKTILKMKGLTRICANPKRKGSYFADHWKEAVNYG
jgi:hypothetical protein